MDYRDAEKKIQASINMIDKELGEFEKAFGEGIKGVSPTERAELFHMVKNSPIHKEYKEKTGKEFNFSKWQ